MATGVLSVKLVSYSFVFSILGINLQTLGRAAVIVIQTLLLSQRRFILRSKL